MIQFGKNQVDVVMVADSNEKLKETTIKAMESLFDSERDIEFNVYLVESCSNFSYKHKNVSIIRPDCEFNYHKFLNIGRKIGRSEYVCLSNNDVIFQKGWASSIIKAMEEDSSILSASPRDHVREPFFDGVIHGYRIGRVLKGWCIFQKRKIYDIIGELEENIPFYCCDNLYAEQLKKHNLTHTEIGGSSVIHEIGGTFRACNIETKSKLGVRRGRTLLQKLLENRNI